MREIRGEDCDHACIVNSAPRNTVSGPEMCADREGTRLAGALGRHAQLLNKVQTWALVTSVQTFFRFKVRFTGSHNGSQNGLQVRTEFANAPASSTSSCTKVHAQSATTRSVQRAGLRALDTFACRCCRVVHVNRSSDLPCGADFSPRAYPVRYLRHRARAQQRRTPGAPH